MMVDGLLIMGFRGPIIINKKSKSERMFKVFYKRQSGTPNANTRTLVWDSMYDERPAKHSVLIMNTTSVPCVTFVEHIRHFRHFSI